MCNNKNANECLTLACSKGMRNISYLHASEKTKNNTLNLSNISTQFFKQSQLNNLYMRQCIYYNISIELF